LIQEKEVLDEKIERIPTGIPGLDNLIQGGFPKGSLIVVAGNPGSGKTILSSQFLYYGAVDYGERGIYVPFAENRKSFMSNLANLGLNFVKLEKEGKFKFLDMVTMYNSSSSRGSYRRAADRIKHRGVYC
jgi:circadian clock protein KaiC